MPTKYKPFASSGGILRASVAAVDKWLKAADYKAIIDCVPRKPGADVAQLKADIRIAAAWYLMRAELQEATPARVRASFKALHDKLSAALDALRYFPAELRPRLRGPDEKDQRDPLERDARLSPTANAEAELERLISGVAQAMQNILVKSGPNQHFDEAERVLRRAWENATGKSPFNDDQREAFVAFELELTRRLNVHLEKSKKPTIPAPSQPSAKK